MIRLHTLGACRIQLGEAVLGPEAERLFAVLLYLVTERGRPTARRALQELLWPEADDVHARHNLRQAIYKLRQYGVELEGGARSVRLPAHQIALDPFDELTESPVAAGDALLSGHGGEYLAGYCPAFSEPYAAWVEGQRAYAHARVARAAVGAMLERRASGRWADVEQLARICLRYDPLNEEATLALAESTALAGSKARALAILDDYIAELGDSTSIQLPATLLRRRITERLPEPPYTAPSESCFAGRDESLRHLHELFGQARAGRGRACMLVGEPGVGKSRLAAEFARVATLQGAQVEHMGCQARDLARPLALFADGVPALLKLPGAIGCSPRSMSYLKRLIEHDPTATTPSEDSRDAAYLYANVRRAVVDLIEAIAAERTLLLVVDDVQWADAASWDILRDLADACGGRKLLLVLTSRVAEPTNAGPGASALRVHQLGGLGDEAAVQLLDAMSGERKRRPSVEARDWMIRAAGGNPLFLRELAIHWLETGRAGEVPPSLAVLLRERLNRLTPLALRIFQTCAVMGNKATFERLEAVLEYRHGEVLDGLQELEAAGLLKARAGGVNSRHELVADAAVGQLAESARQYLHRQVALVLEPHVQAATPNDASMLWDCAEHWRRAGEPARAFKVVMACGAYLLEVGLPSEAAEVYERAQTYASVPAETQQARRDLAAALMHCGRWPQAQAVLRDVVAADEELGPRTEQSYHTHLRLLEADLQMQVDVQELLLRSRAFVTDDRLSPSQRVAFGLWALRFADCAGLMQDIQAVYALITADLDHPAVSAADRCTARMMYHTTCGDLNVAINAAHELVEELRRLRQPAALCRGLRSASRVAQWCGHTEEALSYLHESVRVAEQHNLVMHAIRGCGKLCEYHLVQLELADARRWLARVMEWNAVADDPSLTGAAAVTAAKLALIEAKPETASDALTYLYRVREADTVYNRVDALALQLHAQLAEGDGRRLDESTLESFVRTFDEAIVFGELDYAAFVRYLCVARSDAQRARDELYIYAHERRRERGPVSRLVATALNGDLPAASSIDRR